MLTKNKYSRPGKKLKKIKAIVIHWVGNPGTTAVQNRNFFENRKNGKDGYGSAHYIIGLAGEIIRLIPESEVSYNCGSKIYTKFKEEKIGPGNPNYYTISIELCHINWDGEFSRKTIITLRRLLAELCRKYSLNPIQDIITHNSLVGWKDCPRYYVQKPKEFLKLRKQVKRLMK